MRRRLARRRPGTDGKRRRARLRLWFDFRARHHPSHVLNGHGAASHQPAASFPNLFSQDTIGMLSGAANGSVILLARTGQCSTDSPATPRACQPLSQSPASLERDAFVTAAGDCTAANMDRFLSAVERPPVLSGHVLGVSGRTVMNEPAPMIVSWSLDRSDFRRWDLRERQALLASRWTHDAAVEGCAATLDGPDGYGVVVGRWARFRKWDRISGAELARDRERSSPSVKRRM